ncbi:MAG: SCO family protein [Actinomycetota bacterium]
MSRAERGPGRWRRGAFALAVSALAVGACSSDDGSDAAGGDGGVPLADVELTGPAGETVSTASWVGEPLVINFWYSSCAPCATELADFASVDAERDDVRFVGVNPLDEVDEMNEFAAERGVSYDLFRDEVAEFQTALGITSFPATVFVDGDGHVHETTGVLDDDELNEHVDRLLAGDSSGGGGGESADGDDGVSDDLVDGWNGIVRDPLPQVDAVDLPLVDDPSTSVGFAADPGDIHVVYFGFTACPDVCPTTMADLAVALRMMGDDAERVDVSMVSVDPERDRDHLAKYTNAFVPGSSGLLTDDQELLRAVGDPFGADWEVRVLDDGTVEVDHTAFLYAVDDQGQLRLTWQFGTPSDLMADDMTRLLDLTSA